ncbi:MAG TPA: helix-turn-helix transcriptional regulator [Ktedonobacterales bacterium]|nr:helix-turn-helix transcriptional regulator [Ktedonobacterales bacterium]
MVDDTPTRVTIAQKIDALFRTSGREYTYAEVAEGIRQLGGPTISTTQLWELRNGVKTNPRIEHLEALARFFGVPIRYFLPDDELGAELYARLKLLTAMRDSRIERIALRASGLSPQTLQAIAEIIERARQIEGVRNGDSAATSTPPDDESGQRRDPEEPDP